MKRKPPMPLVIGLLFLILSMVVSAPFPTSLNSDIKVFNSPVSYPLPTVPEPILANGTIMVEVNAAGSAERWVAKVISDRMSSVLIFINSSEVEDGKWVLYFTVNGTLVPGLYSLNLAYNDGEEAVNHTQSRCIWVLEDWPDKLKISHITDTHLPYGADAFARYAYEMNLIQPDLFIHTGDVVDTETLASGWQYFQKILDWLQIPGYFVPGNHDHSGMDGAFYQKYCGLLNYSIVIGDFLFIALNNGDDGTVSLEQLAWAERILQMYPGKVKIIGFHYPFFSRPPGESIEGSWDDIESLTPYMYYTWNDSLSESSVFLRLVEEYDVRLILAGHVHQDVNYIYNDRHYFVTTAPCGGSLREGGHHGSRIVEINNEGNLEFDAYTEARFFEEMSNMPIEHIIYGFRTPNDGTRPAVSAFVINLLEQNFTDARLEFIVSSEYDVDDYEFRQPERTVNGFPTLLGVARVTHYETFTTAKGHHFVAYLDLPAYARLELILTAVEDEDTPLLEVEVLDTIEENNSVPLSVRATDGGWGIDTVWGFNSVWVEYSTDGGTEWTILHPPIALLSTLFPVNISKDALILEYPIVEFEVSIPRQPAGTEVMVKVYTQDYACGWPPDTSSIHCASYEFNYTVPLPPLPTYTLSIDSSPVSGLSFTLDGESYVTPYSVDLEEGSYEVEVPDEVTIEGTTYSFEQWADGVTEASRTIELTQDASLAAQYEEVPIPETGIPLWQIGIVVVVVAIVVVVAVLKMRKPA